ncbi:hypothetical protein ACWEOZ_35505 [Actinoplanes sp. NPDC004185]
MDIAARAVRDAAPQSRGRQAIVIGADEVEQLRPVDHLVRIDQADPDPDQRVAAAARRQERDPDDEQDDGETRATRSSASFRARR